MRFVSLVIRGSCEIRSGLLSEDLIAARPLVCAWRVAYVKESNVAWAKREVFAVSLGAGLCILERVKQLRSFHRESFLHRGGSQ